MNDAAKPDEDLGQVQAAAGAAQRVFAPPQPRPLANVLRHFVIARVYLVQALKTKLAYRGDFVAEMLAAALAEMVGLVVVYVMFTKVTALGDWTWAHVLFVYGFSMIPRALFGFSAMAFYRFSEMYLVEGQFDRVLLRPANVLFQVVMENVDFRTLGDLLLGFLILFLAWRGLDLTGYAVWEWGLFVVMVLSATAVIFGVFLSLMAVSFWMTDRVGLLPPVYNLMAFARYPLTIYHRAWVRIVLSVVLPFGFAAFYPATFFMGAGAPEAFRMEFAITPLVGLGTFGIGYAVWVRGLKRYESTGT